MDDFGTNQKITEKTDDEYAGGPGKTYEIYTQSEIITERLKLLDYENEIVNFSDSLKAIPRHYFVNSTNTGEQFYFFTSIAVWLIKKAGIDPGMEMPHEFDDPKEVEINFPTNKLMQGSGSQCIYVLLKLSEFAVKDIEILKSIEVIKSQNAEINKDESEIDDAEITADQFDIEEDIADENEEDDAEEQIMHNEFMSELSNDNEIIEMQNEPLRVDESTDVAAFQQELQRVVPQLKITIRPNLKDWRMHGEQINKYEQIVEEQFLEIRPYLNKNTEEIKNSVERIQMRENHLNEQFSGLLNTYRQAQNELAMYNEQYKERSGTLSDLSRTLNDLNEEIYKIKQDIDEQGTQKMSGAPIVKAKKAILHLKKEIFTLRVQICATEQTLMQNQLSDRINNAANYLSF